MASMSRFIQFNNEQIDARQMISYENLTRALANNRELQLTERQLMELNPQEQIASMSVFWRHRDEEKIHLGRLSDIYLLSEGFWRHFSLSEWRIFLEELEDFKFPKLLSQLVLLGEEFRLMEYVQKSRPGTQNAFSIRREAYLTTYHHQIRVNQQKGLFAESLMNYFYIAIHEGQQKLPSGGIFDEFQPLLYLWQNVFDSRSTRDTATIVLRLAPQIEEIIQKELFHNFYALLDQISNELIVDHEHKGVCGVEEGNSEEAKETIEETFRSWHRESEDDSGTHMRFELERGNEGKSLSNEAVEGRDDQQPTEEGAGGDQNAEAKPKKSDSVATKALKRKYTKSGKNFGKEHENVIYEEKKIAVVDNLDQIRLLEKWRVDQQPQVKALATELRKRMVQKKTSKRTNLSYGRFNAKQVLDFMTETRPKPFYKKDAPSKPLDAVFGLLIDGSASMIDKMDETKQAVLLFHDVLRELEIVHELVVFYEDAYEASKEAQPNTFEWLHSFEDGKHDAIKEIASMDAHEDNRDGFAIRWMTDRLKKREEKHRFLLMFSDGEPSAFEYAQNGILDSAEAVIEAEKQGITVLHLFLNTEKPSDEQLKLFATVFGKQSIVADQVEQFSDITLRTLRKVLSHVVQGM